MSDHKLPALGFSAATVIISFIETLQKSATWLYDAKSDPQGILNDEDGEPTEETGYQSDGSAAIRYGVSVGTGRGSAKVELSGAQLGPVATALAAYDPEADLSGLSPEECIERTIDTDKDGVVSFKLSLAKNSRQVKIPGDQWAGYVALMQANANTVPAAVDHYRAMVAAANAAAK